MSILKSSKLQTLFNRFEEIHNLKASRNNDIYEKISMKIKENYDIEENFSRFA